MKELKINEKIISFKNPDQILNMGGPWIGELFLDADKIANNVIIDNFYYDESQNYFYFIVYHKISNWKKENYFSIYILDIKNSNIFSYDLKFKQIFIVKINNNELIYHDAFHDKDDINKKTTILTPAPQRVLIKN